VHVKSSRAEKERRRSSTAPSSASGGDGARASFTVRRSPTASGVERTFPLHSPRIDRIEVVRRARVRRSKLYYLRSLAGKAARLREKRINVVPATAPESQTE